MNARVSVVIPTYKRPHLLDRCVAAVLAQDFPAERLESLVVDDAGDPATWRAVARRRRAHGRRPRLRYLQVHGAHGPAAARNAGWRAASGDIIAFTDDDCIPGRHWVSEGVAALKEARAAVWGRVIVPLPKDPTDFERDTAGLASAGFVTANCFCRRGVLAEIGGLDENFTAPWREDTDLYFSLLERGYRVAQAKRAAVVHPVRPAGWGESLRRQRKILFDALLYKKHPRLYRQAIRRWPRWDYYAILMLLVLAVTGWAANVPFLFWGAGSAWLLATARLFIARLRRTSRRPLHVADMLLTSALIPPVAVFWRFVGAVRFRVMFF